MQLQNKIKPLKNNFCRMNTKNNQIFKATLQQLLRFVTKTPLPLAQYYKIQINHKNSQIYDSYKFTAFFRKEKSPSRYNVIFSVVQYHQHYQFASIVQSSKYYKNMIRRPSYKDFLNQTIQSTQKSLYPPPSIPSHQRPPLSPYHTKRATVPQNSSKDYSSKTSALAQTLLQIPSNPSSMRHTQGYSRITSDKKQNMDSSFHYIPRQKNSKSPIKQPKTNQWKPSWQQSSSYNDYQIKKTPPSSISGDDKFLHHQFTKTSQTLTHTRSKARISSPLEQYFAQSKEYPSNGRSKLQITEKITFKNEAKTKPCISAAVLPMTQLNKSRSTTPVNVPNLQNSNLLAPIQFRKKPTSCLGKSKEQIEYLQRSISKSKVRNSCKPQLIKTQSIKNKISLNDFIVGKKMGEGRFGSVFMVVHKLTRCIYALKKIPKTVLKQHMMIDQFSLQVKLQAAVSHPNLVSVYAVFDDKQHVYLLLQYLSGGSLYGQLKKKGKFSEEQTAQRTKALCKAVQALHLHGIAHRDIKPQNIMISQGVCKLGDFGWATLCDERRRTYCGTTDYVSPQIVEGKQYGPGVDMWCVGVLAYELITGRPPFYHLSKQQTFRRIQEATPSFPSSMSKEAIDFIGGLLRKVPEERMSSTDALAHGFFTKFQ